LDRIDPASFLRAFDLRAASAASMIGHGLEELAAKLIPINQGRDRTRLI
jgi:hypothetical protein